MSDISKQVERAKELLNTVRHIAVATVNQDGTPHNTPVFWAKDDDLRFYWSSHPESQHSKNIELWGQVFIVLFDSMEKGGGLYIQAKAHMLQDEWELARGHAAFNKARKAAGKSEVTVQQLVSDSPQRLYCAEPVKFWVNAAERDEHGYVIRDERHEISKKELL